MNPATLRTSPVGMSPASMAWKVAARGMASTCAKTVSSPPEKPLSIKYVCWVSDASVADAPTFTARY